MEDETVDHALGDLRLHSWVHMLASVCLGVRLMDVSVTEINVDLHVTAYLTIVITILVRALQRDSMMPMV
jgi:hypothetical protein